MQILSCSMWQNTSLWPFIVWGSQWSFIEKAQTLCDSRPDRCCVQKIASLAHCLLAASEIIPVPTHSPSNVTILHHPNVLPGLLSAATVELLLNRFVASCKVQCNRNLSLEGAFVALGTHLIAAHLCRFELCAASCCTEGEWWPGILLGSGLDKKRKAQKKACCFYSTVEDQVFSRVPRRTKCK